MGLAKRQLEYDEAVHDAATQIALRGVTSSAGLGWVTPLSASGWSVKALAMAVPLRYGIEWLRIWELVGQGKTPFTWAEYLAAFRQLELIESDEWHGLIADAANPPSAQPAESGS